MNLPNILTLFRAVMIPFFAAAFLIEGLNDGVALAVFVVASLTDILDGYIARKQNLVTDFGKLMDPLADKLMVMTAFICFVSVGFMHPAVVIVVMAREFLVTGLRSLAAAKGRVIAADIFGKLKTILQDVTVIIVLLWQALGGNAGILGTVSHLFIWVMTLVTVFSAANYCIKNKDLFGTK